MINTHIVISQSLIVYDGPLIWAMYSRNAGVLIVVDAITMFPPLVRANVPILRPAVHQPPIDRFA